MIVEALAIAVAQVLVAVGIDQLLDKRDVEAQIGAELRKVSAELSLPEPAVQAAVRWLQHPDVRRALATASARELPAAIDSCIESFRTDLANAGLSDEPDLARLIADEIIRHPDIPLVDQDMAARKLLAEVEDVKAGQVVLLDAIESGDDDWEDLPPRVRLALSLLRSNYPQLVQLLAEQLREPNPLFTVRKLLDQEPPWLKNGPGQAWATIGDF